MTIVTRQQAYAQATGTSTIPAVITQTRNPTSSDVNYPIGQQWLNTSSGTLYYLASQTSPQGNLTSNWMTPGLPALTDGQVVIGSSVGPALANTITAGAGVTITNGHNTITISSPGASVSWTDEGANFGALSGNGYFCTSGLTATLPAAPSQGNIIDFVVDTAAAVTIQANAGQTIRVGSGTSSVAGTAVNTARGDALNLVFRSSDNTWLSYTGPQGTWTLA